MKSTNTMLISIILIVLPSLFLQMIFLNTKISKANDRLLEIESSIDNQAVSRQIDRNRILELKLEVLNLKKRVNAIDNESQNIVETKISTVTEQIDTKSTKTSSNDNKRNLLGIFEATAYTDDVQSQGKWVGQTTTGRKPQVGVIAVDPKVIPLNTKLYVEGYGECVAGDTGGLIKGNIIDLFFDTRDEVNKWGRKQVKVWEVN